MHRNPGIRLTERDLSLLGTLARKVRVLTIRQIADHWFQADEAFARKRLSILIGAGWLAHQRLMTRLAPDAVEPVFVWQPGQSAPSFSMLAHRTTLRWRARSSRLTSVFLATPQAAGLFGGNPAGRLPHPLQVSHDTGLAAVYLRLCKTVPQQAAHWVGEDSLGRPVTKRTLRADAVLTDGQGRVYLAIEYGGYYRANKYRRFHEHCQSKELPYAIW